MYAVGVSMMLPKNAFCWAIIGDIGVGGADLATALCDGGDCEPARALLTDSGSIAGIPCIPALSGSRLANRRWDDGDIMGDTAGAFVDSTTFVAFALAPLL